jgi:hypothetical protein
MRTQAEKNFSVAVTPFFPSVDQVAESDPVRQKQRQREHDSQTYSNHARSGVSTLAGESQSEPAVHFELLHNQLDSNEVSDEGTIFPYIPRKRQERCGLLIDYLYLPAPEAGGDQVDFLILGENRIGVLLADVSGKIGHERLPIIKTALRSNSAGLSAAGTLRYVGQRLSEICTNGFAITAFYSIFDQNKRLLHFSSAGHLPMLIHRAASSKVFLLNTVGSPFGSQINGHPKNTDPAEARSESPQSSLMSGLNTLKSERVALRQNDLIVQYSDGLLAVRNRQGEFFGRQRIIDFVRKHGELNPTALLVELRRTIEKFTDGRPVSDDVTVIVIKNVLRDLAKPHPEASGCELENHFLTTDEEQAILEVLREHPEAKMAQILEHLTTSEYGYLTHEQIQTYLAQNGHWLHPWRARNGKVENKITKTVSIAKKNGVPQNGTPANEQFQQNLLTAFPIRQLLYKRYDIHGGSSEVDKALQYFNIGDYERALAEFTSLRQTIKPDASVHCFFGNLYLLLNEPAKAQHEYLMALKLDPRCVHAMLALSYLALLQEDYYTAIDSITMALRLDKNLTTFQKFMEKLIAAVEKLENHSEWIT